MDEKKKNIEIKKIEWIEREMRKIRQEIVIIQNDRSFMENVRRENVWIESGVKSSMEKGLENLEEWSEKVMEEEEREM